MIAALLLLAQIVPVPPEPKAVQTTIAAIRADPKRFDGQIVRLHGWVSSCQPSSCLVYERPSNAPAGPGASLPIAEDKKFEDRIRALLPTYVEFDARLNAPCTSATSCSDRAPVLTIVTLRGVVSPEPPPFEN